MDMNPPASLGTIDQAWRQAGVERLEARLLLQHVLGVDHAWLIAHGSEPLSSAASAHFSRLLARRLAGEPVAYLLGQRAFHGLELLVSPAVLIPRPDSETLVDLALALLPTTSTDAVLDLGTGSGAIALAIAAQRPHCPVTAVDRSAAALQVAQRNAENLGLSRVRLLQGDWYQPLGGQRFALIVANPPYIHPHDPHLQQGDLRFEPRAALTDEQDGLACLRRIIAGADAHLLPGATLAVEHGYDQATAVQALFQDAGFTAIHTRHDLGGQARVTHGLL